MQEKERRMLEKKTGSGDPFGGGNAARSSFETWCERSVCTAVSKSIQGGRAAGSVRPSA